MSTLVLEDLSDPKVRTLMRARTLTVLERLNPSRRTQVMRFLAEARLVSPGSSEESPIISLSGSFSARGADLSGADLSTLPLAGVELAAADLSDANLQGSFAIGANLGGANLQGANLRGAILSFANLSEAEGISNEDLDQQADTLEGATMPNGQKYEDWLKDRERRGENVENE